MLRRTMKQQDRLLLQLLAFDLIKLNKDLAGFNNIISEYKKFISDTDFTQEFSPEATDSYCQTAILMNEMLNAINDFESKLLLLAGTVKEKPLVQILQIQVHRTQHQGNKCYKRAIFHKPHKRNRMAVYCCSFTHNNICRSSYNC